MAEQPPHPYYQNGEPTVKSAPTDPSQVHFYPYGVPPATEKPLQYPQLEGAYMQQPPPPPAYPNVWAPMQPHQRNTERIRDYMPWSIVNICVGGIVLGIIAVLFSFMTIRRRERNDVQSARTWSKITLIYNILVDLVVAALIIIIIIVYATAARRANTYVNGY